MTQTPIEMARDVAACAAKASKRLNLQHIANEILAGLRDEGLAVQSALAMHARLTAEHQAAVAELVEAADCYRSQFGQALEAYDIPCDTNQINAESRLSALIAKHRAPDAFDTWAEGLIDE